MENVSNLSILTNILINGMITVFFVLLLVFLLGKFLVKFINFFNLNTDKEDNIEKKISNKIKNLEEVSKIIIIGSSSKRRELQLKKINKNVSVLNIRGNIDTRIQKLEEKKFL